MASKQSAVLAKVKELLADSVGVGGRVYRNKPSPKNRDKLPCIIIRPQRMPIEGEHMPRVLWGFTFLVIVLGRGDESDDEIDPTLCDVYERLMTERTLAGTVQDISPIQVQWTFEEGDGENCAAISEWRVQFQTTGPSLEN